MNTLTILNHSTFSIKFTVIYERNNGLSFISSSYYGNGKYETLPLPDELILGFSIKTISNNIESEIFRYGYTLEYFFHLDKVYELIGTSKDDVKLFDSNLNYLKKKEKYIYISNTISSLISCNINFTVVKTNYNISMRIIRKNKFKIFHLPIKSKEITIEFLIETSNNQLTVFTKKDLNNYEELPKCYEINKPLFSSSVYVKEIQCKNKFNP